MYRLPRTDAELVPLVLGDGLSLVALALLVALGAALALYAYRAARARRAESTGDASTRDRVGGATDRVREGPRGTRSSATPGKPTDEERVRRWLREAGGELPQKELTARSGWSKSKVSRLLSRMEDEGSVEKVSLGRENVVVLREDES